MFGFKKIHSKTLIDLGVQNKDDPIVKNALKKYGVTTKAVKGIVLNSTFGKLLTASEEIKTEKMKPEYRASQMSIYRHLLKLDDAFNSNNKRITRLTQNDILQYLGAIDDVKSCAAFEPGFEINVEALDRLKNVLNNAYPGAAKYSF